MTFWNLLCIHKRGLVHCRKESEKGILEKSEGCGVGMSWKNSDPWSRGSYISTSVKPPPINPSVRNAEGFVKRSLFSFLFSEVSSLFVIGYVCAREREKEKNTFHWVCSHRDAPLVLQPVGLGHSYVLPGVFQAHGIGIRTGGICFFSTAPYLPWSQPRKII